MRKHNAIVTIILLIFFVKGCINLIPMGNNNTLIKTESSPNNLYQAVIFERNINATTKTSYHLSIMKRGNEITNLTGNVFVSYEKFDVEWIDDNNLKIYNKKESIKFKKLERYKDIHMIYLN